MSKKLLKFLFKNIYSPDIVSKNLFKSLYTQIISKLLMVMKLIMMAFLSISKKRHKIVYGVLYI